MKTALFLSLLFPVLAAAEMPAPYEPQPVQVPSGATYVRPDGSIEIVGNDGLEEMLKQFTDLFTKTHPGFKFTLLMKGSSVGIGGIATGASALAPMGREGWPLEMASFKEAYGYLPLDIHMGYDDYTRPGHKGPPGVYVSAKNPLKGLTLEQVERIFTRGNRKGDLTMWSQLGLKGAYASRRIHLYGPPDDGTPATSQRLNLFHKLPFAATYEALPGNKDVIAAVKADPFGMGLVEFFDSGSVPAVRLVPLARRAGEEFVLPTYDNVHEGRYAMSPNLHLYLNRAPGKVLDPFVQEFARMVLSKEGQAIIESLKNGDDGYVPLAPSEIASELAKLN
jgi:phosphate transport system substrate-binding protein